MNVNGKIVLKQSPVSLSKRPSAITLPKAAKPASKDPVKVSETEKKTSFLGKSLFESKRISNNVMLDFITQLSTFIDAGVPIEKSLGIIGKSTKHKYMKSVILEIQTNIQGGGTLPEALGFYPNVFDNVFVNSIRSGDASGKTAEVLKSMAEHMEKQKAIENKVKSALTYPVIVMIMAFSILLFLMTFIVPKFKDVFADILNGKPLPFLTQVVMMFSDFIVGHWFILICSIVAIVACFIFWKRTKSGRYLVDKFVLLNPIFGPLVKKAYVSKILHISSTMLESGVQVLDVLKIASNCTNNSLVSKEMMSAHDAVKEGEEIHSALSPLLFDEAALGMAEVGTTTGRLPLMFEKLAKRYDSDIDKVVSSLTSIIEPVMIVGLALMVGTIVLAVFLPMVELLKGMTGM